MVTQEDIERCGQHEAAKQKAFKRIKDAPPGNVFRWNPDDFSEFVKDSYVLDIADITSRSGQFLQRLKEEIINEDWDLEAVMVKEEPTDYVGQPLHIRRKLDLFFTNQQKPELSVYGEYGDNILIREGVEKPFSDGTFNKFRQGRLGRSLEYLFSGTDIIPLDFHDWSHSIEVPLRRSVGDYLHRRHPTLEVYPQGVRNLYIELVPINIAIVLVEEEMERFKEREGTITSGRERIAELEGYAKNAEPFISYSDLQPLPDQFREALEQKYDRIWTAVENAFKEVGKALKNNSPS